MANSGLFFTETVSLNSLLSRFRLVSIRMFFSLFGLANLDYDSLLNMSSQCILLISLLSFAAKFRSSSSRRKRPFDKETIANRQGASAYQDH